MQLLSADDTIFSKMYCCFCDNFINPYFLVKYILVKEKYVHLVKAQLHENKNAPLKSISSQFEAIYVIYTTIGIDGCSLGVDDTSITTKPYILQKICFQRLCSKFLGF